ncbi:E3 ubiquitin-protein ligase E3D-like [Xenopus laevis]|uniref:E3 ubiquitin-protein ligase E3D n=1 Tax=Xenopus laevis TaxID=8355 RepID=A0A8J1KQT7_XENLA|nr:E3 ubiquitin-protein ligase E3D-like [Xenopus laevis]
MPPMLKEILKIKNYTFYCQSCGELIIKEQSRRLTRGHRPLLLLSICLGLHMFSFKECFLGDTFLLLNKEYISDPLVENNEKSSVPRLADANALISKENTKVICRRCKAMLGEKVSSDTIKYYITEIMIQPSSQGYYTSSRNIKSIILQLFMEHSTCRSTFRFCLQNSDCKLFLLLLFPDLSKGVVTLRPNTSGALLTPGSVEDQLVQAKEEGHPPAKHYVSSDTENGHEPEGQ